MMSVMKKERNKMTKGEQEFLRLMKIAGNVIIKEDLSLLKELAKH